MRENRFRIRFLALFLALMPLAWLEDPGRASAMNHGGVVAPVVEEARSAGIPETMLSRILCLSVDSRISPDHTLVLCNIFIKAKKDNLPLESLIGKMEEGVAKGIPSNTLISVLERKIEEYQFVRTLLLRKFPPTAEPAGWEDYLSLFAGSLDSGLSREEMESFIEKSPTAPLPMLAVAVENWTLLKQIGFDNNQTTKILFAGLRFRSFTPSWRFLANIVLASRNKGIPDPAIADAAAKALSEKRELNSLMDELEFTGRDLRRGPNPNGSKSSGR
jgi:hypothetical protein